MRSPAAACCCFLRICPSSVPLTCPSLAEASEEADAKLNEAEGDVVVWPTLFPPLVRCPLERLLRKKRIIEAMSMSRAPAPPTTTTMSRPPEEFGGVAS